MDLSKLPKLSDTKNQVPAEPDSPAAAQPVPQQVIIYRQPGAGVDIWISLIIGIILCSLGRSFFWFAAAKVTHHTYHSALVWDSDGPKGHAGDEIAYFDIPGETAWSDMGIFLFGLTLLFEAAAKTMLLIKPGAASRVVLMLAVVLTFLAVFLNAIACVKMFSVGITPLLSGLAVAFGGWILFDEWATLQRSRVTARH